MLHNDTLMRYAKIMLKNNRLCLLRMPVLGALCAAIFVFVSANSALAQDWRFEPILKIGGEYDDNATLDSRTDEELELNGYLVDARVAIKYASPTTSFFVEPRRAGEARQ